MAGSLLGKLTRNLSNIPGKSISQKILVIESDDWGSIRIPSRQVFDQLVKEGYALDSNYFTKNDGLESVDDLANLFDLLSGFKDRFGNYAVMTALCILGNPNFEKIKQSGFSTYYFEPFHKTALQYDGTEAILDMWKAGKKRGIFIPEFHGREHLNVRRWMKGLRKGLPTTTRTFDLGLTGLHAAIAKESRGDYQAAFDVDGSDDILYHKEVLEQGVQLFKQLLEFDPVYFCPTNGPFHNSLESVVYDQGIRLMNTAKIQIEPLGSGKFKRHFHYLGQTSSAGLKYLTRNVIFEPSQPSAINWVDRAMSEINIAFRWGKPAIVSTHRVNYVSRINEENRTKGLLDLKSLLSSVLKKWPDVQFLSSGQLGEFL